MPANTRLVPRRENVAARGAPVYCGRHEARAAAAFTGMHCGSSPTRFPIRFDPWYRILSHVVLLPPGDAFVEIDGDEVRVRMSWAFSARSRARPSARPRRGRRGSCSAAA
jgi:hypothetical protein